MQMSTPHDSSMLPPEKCSPVHSKEDTHLRFICVGLAALIFFSRLWLVAEWATPVPYLDQWDAEAMALYIPLLHGDFNPIVLVAAHNEHRITLTRLLSVSLFLITKHWPVWELFVANAALHALTAWIVLRAAAIHAPRNIRGLALGGAFVIFLSIAGWQNAIWGFQSQFYFTNICAASAFGALRPNRPILAPLLFAAVGLFTTASGCLIAASIVATLLMTGLKQRKLAAALQRALPAVLLFGIGLVLIGDAPHHDAIHAKSAPQFFGLLIKCLSWPWFNTVWPWVVLWSPVLAYMWHRRSEAVNQLDLLICSFASYTLLCSLALAITRGGGLPMGPLSRHQDTLLFGAVAQTLSAFWLLRKTATWPKYLGFAYLHVAAVGLIQSTHHQIAHDLPYRQQHDLVNLAMIKHYVATGDISAFTAFSEFPGPYPASPYRLAEVLDDPLFRRALPSEFHEGINVKLQAPALLRFSPLLAAVISLFLTARWIRVTAERHPESLEAQS